MELLLGCGVAVILFCAVIFAATVIRGFVLSKLWAWFVVPIFHVPMLTIAQAYGLCLVAILFTANLKTVQTDDKKKSTNSNLAFVFYPFIPLVMGWILKTVFM